MVRVSRLVGVVSFAAAALAASHAAAQVIPNNTPIQSITVKHASTPIGPVTVGATKGFSAEATLADAFSSIRVLGGGGSAFFNVHWAPGIPVGICGTSANFFSSQNFHINLAGGFQTTWSPGQPNTLTATGQMSMPTQTPGATVAALLECGNHAASGSMAATWTGTHYDGTYSFNGTNGAITVVGVKWSTSDPSIATINDRGMVTGVSPGLATITATFGSLCWQMLPGVPSCVGSVSGSLQVQVNAAPPPQPVLTAGPDQVVECASPAGTPVLLQGQLFFQPTSPLTYTWTGPFPAASGLVATVPFPQGSHTATLTISDGTRSASDSANITVVDTTAPVISSATANPAIVWPPDGRMVPVSIAVAASDACSAQVTCQGVSVTADDGATAADWEPTGPLSLNVRAARSGAAGGRTYTVTVACSDGSGNTATKTVSILVPHDRR